MATETKSARWKVILGYSAFSLFAFILCFFLTFPYDMLRSRVATEAAKSGFAVRIGSMRPGLRGLTATNVRISQPPGPLSGETLAALTSGDASAASMLGAAELGESIVLDSVAMRPSLFPLGVTFHADALGGTIHGSLGGRKDLQVRVRLEDLDPSKGNLKALSGLELAGTLSGSISLTLPRAPGAGGRAGEPDLSQADGQLALEGHNLLIRETAAGTGVLSPGSPLALLFSKGMPEIPVGELQALIRVEKGQGTVDALQIRSDKLEVQGTGTVKLNKRLQYSEPDMTVKLRVEQELVNALGPAGLGVNILPPDKDDPKFRVGSLRGSLGKLTFLPKSR